MAEEQNLKLEDNQLDDDKTDEDVKQGASSSNKKVKKETKHFSKSFDKEVSQSTTTATSSSPEPNCSICLEQVENKSFTDSCFHMFCFSCLAKWSKVKTQCPLCKQRFKSILHNVRSYSEYCQHYINGSRISEGVYSYARDSQLRNITAFTPERSSKRSHVDYSERRFERETASHRMRYGPHSVNSLQHSVKRSFRLIRRENLDQLNRQIQNITTLAERIFGRSHVDYSEIRIESEIASPRMRNNRVRVMRYGPHSVNPNLVLAPPHLVKRSIRRRIYEQLTRTRQFENSTLAPERIFERSHVDYSERMIESEIASHRMRNNRVRVVRYGPHSVNPNLVLAPPHLVKRSIRRRIYEQLTRTRQFENSTLALERIFERRHVDYSERRIQNELASHRMRYAPHSVHPVGTHASQQSVSPGPNSSQSSSHVSLKTTLSQKSDNCLCRRIVLSNTAPFTNPTEVPGPSTSMDAKFTEFPTETSNPDLEESNKVELINLSSDDE